MTAGKVVTGTMGSKSEAGLDTLCHAKAAVSLASTACLETQLCHEWRLPARPRVRNSGWLAQQEGTGQ